MLWLVFRMHIESGAAEAAPRRSHLARSDRHGNVLRDRAAPDLIGWWAHQMPLWGHRVTGGVVYLVELALPFLMWGPRTVRTAVFAAMVAMQIAILLTATTLFNYLSIALALFVLDDTHLGVPVAVAADRRGGRRRSRSSPRCWSGSRPSSFLPLVPVARPFEAALLPVRRVLSTFRSINAYHLFAHMTLVRREAVIEGSEDGTTWLPYEFRYKPAIPTGPPPFVAPHQPRVDFQLWFLLPARNRVPAGSTRFSIACSPRPTSWHPSSRWTRFR